MNPAETGQAEDSEAVSATRKTPFLSEWVAGGRPPNQLPISAVCNCRCLFCSNHLNPFPVVSGVFRSVEDIRLQLCAMPNHDDPIRLSDSLPGRISEGEALIHPQLFEILDIVRRKYFYNTLCFTTNASMLDAAFLKRLSSYRPVEITVSMHTVNPEHWARIFHSDENAAATAIASIRLIRERGMDLIGTIVPLPRICGWDEIECTYARFAEYDARQVILYWPGVTVRTRPEVAEELTCPIAEFTEFAARMKGLHKTAPQPLPDMTAPLSVNVSSIARKTLSGNVKTGGGAHRRVIWLASRAAGSRLAEFVARVPQSDGNSHVVFEVENATYGGNIVAAGLLMVEDFVAAGLKALERWPDTDLLLVPSEPFDSFLQDLRGSPALAIADALRRPVWVVQPDGVINNLLSARIGTRRRSFDSELRETMRCFNRAWSDSDGRETALDIIAAYPVTTPIGDLERPHLREWMRTERCTSGDAPISQHFDVLDPEHALCVERWDSNETRGHINRWTRLVKREAAWRVEGISQGSEP